MLIEQKTLECRILPEYIWIVNVKFLKQKLPYSREQKHVSISDTPMLLIEINSISNMGCLWSEWAEIKIL